MDYNTPKVVIIGGGAAGFFTAIQIKERSAQPLEVIILEKTSKLLSKVRISGGGRCNVTNACDNTVQFAKQYPRGEKFLKKAFGKFNNNDVINWFSHKKVPLIKENDGRMFPATNTSQTIVDLFLDLTTRYNVVIHTQTQAQSICHHGDVIEIQTNNGTFEAQAVVIAAGGYPKPEMYKWLLPGVAPLSIVSPVPSLFSFNLKGNPIVFLQGLSVAEAQVKVLGTKLQASGPLLITHWGLSGPAILKLSAWGALILNEKQYAFDILVNWLPDLNEESVNLYLQEQQMASAQRKIINKNPFGLPNRLWQYFLECSGIHTEEQWTNLKAKQRNILAKNLCNMQLAVSGKTTYKEEFVTAGGIDTSYVDVKTMEYKSMPHLYVVGEALNIDGITGGFNFQNAWTTGYIAANAIAEAMNVRD